MSLNVVGCCVFGIYLMICFRFCVCFEEGGIVVDLSDGFVLYEKDV